MTSSTTNAVRMRPLPQPEVVVRLLQIVAVVQLLFVLAAMVMLWLAAKNKATVLNLDLGDLPPSTLAVTSIYMLFHGLFIFLVLYAFSYVVNYAYSTALNARLAERREQTRAAEAAQERTAAAGAAALPEQVVSLLAEINENTLLSEADKARKRTRLADARRRKLVTEVRQLTQATKWPDARARIEDLLAEFPEDTEVQGLKGQLETAIKEHQELDVATTGEQIRSYIQLGLWEKARQSARQLAEKYPTHPDAQKMENVVRLEEEVSRKEDRLRLYREIEHLVARKHYRDAKRTAQTLMERYPESAEAASLKGQMDELLRNADIETRREMEAQIIEYTKQNRHREALEVAQTLMEQFPESPQALALKEQIDKLRERAGAGS